MSLFGKCTTDSIFKSHNFSKWQVYGKEERTEGEHSILGGNVITWHGLICKQQRKCRDCNLMNYREDKL